MAKAPTSVIGLDLGRHALKSVLLQRRSGGQVALTHYAAHRLERPIESSDHLAAELKALLKSMGGSAKTCGVAVSSNKALLRIIEQPETPTGLLREALRLNGMSLLNQDCRDLVLDCDELAESAHPAGGNQSTAPANGPKRYLVGGVPRSEVSVISAAFESVTTPFSSLQLAPACLFNAFEFARPQEFNHEAFFLIDIGHGSSTMLIGAKRALVLVRNIDFGGQALIEALSSLSGESAEGALMALEHEDEVMVENTRMALSVLAREVAGSIGFFEARREETISAIYVSGAAARSKTMLQVLSEEIHMPCKSWNPLETCELELPGRQREAFAQDAPDLHVACGAAAELLNA
ncbi:MAG: pilus assembly protein PilM [Chthoniobacteraceae bacterium]